MDEFLLVILISVAAFLLGVVLLRVSVRGEGWYRSALPWAGSVLGILALAGAGFMGFVGVTERHKLAGPDRPTAEELARPIADFEFRLVDDDDLRAFRDLRGRVVLLNLWATWCSPCVREFPYLNRLQETYGEQGLVVITLSDEAREELFDFRYPETPTTVNAYIAGAGQLPHPLRRGFRILPTTYVIDRDGYIRDFFIGSRSYDQLEQKVVPLL